MWYWQSKTTLLKAPGSSSNTGDTGHIGFLRPPVQCHYRRRSVNGEKGARWPDATLSHRNLDFALGFASNARLLHRDNFRPPLFVQKQEVHEGYFVLCALKDTEVYVFLDSMQFAV